MCYLSLLAYIDVLGLRPAVECLHLIAHFADVFEAHIKQLPPWRLAWQCHLRMNIGSAITSCCAPSLHRKIVGTRPSRFDWLHAGLREKELRGFP